MDTTLSQAIETPLMLSTVQGEFDFVDRNRRRQLKRETSHDIGSPRELEQFLAKTEPESLTQHKLQLAEKNKLKQ